MKKIIIPVAAVVLAMFTACGGTKTNEGNTEAAAAESEPVAEVEQQALVVPEDPDSERGPVWTSLSGAYFFCNDGISAMISIALTQDEPSTLYYNEVEYPATVDKTTGQILAYDEAGKLVFCGYVYDGGNSLGGNFQGERIFMQGPGD